MRTADEYESEEEVDAGDESEEEGMDVEDAAAVSGKKGAAAAVDAMEEEDEPRESCRSLNYMCGRKGDSTGRWCHGSYPSRARSRSFKCMCMHATPQAWRPRCGAPEWTAWRRARVRCADMTRLS